MVKVDGKVRTDATYPAGFMDVIDIEKTDEHFRLMYDSKGRFVTHRITKVRVARSPMQAHALHALHAHACMRSRSGSLPGVLGTVLAFLVHRSGCL